MDPVRWAELESHCHQSKARHAEEFSRSAGATVCGVNSRRVKKYGCGSASGSRNAADALRDESSEDPKPLVRASRLASNARRRLGNRRAAAAARTTLEVERNGL